MILAGLRPAVGFTNPLQPAPSTVMQQPASRPVLLLQAPSGAFFRQADPVILQQPASRPSRYIPAGTRFRPAREFPNPLRPARNFFGVKWNRQNLRVLPPVQEERHPAFTAPSQELLLR